jgi:hypothetical protein
MEIDQGISENYTNSRNFKPENGFFTVLKRNHVPQHLDLRLVASRAMR